MKLLWADDDSFGLLQPLARLLERQGGFALRKAANYKDAIRSLEEAQAAGNRIESLLVDIILPEASSGGSLASDLGLKLAEVASTLGVKSICFLTVVRQDEVIDKYADLEKSYPDVRFAYFDKTTLLSRGEIEALIRNLQN